MTDPPAAAETDASSGNPAPLAGESTDKNESAADDAPKAAVATKDGEQNVAAPPVAPAQEGGWRSLGLFGVLSIVSIWADLSTKAWAVRHLEQNGFRLPPKEIMKGRIWLVLARNPGGAWGMLHEQPEKVRRPFFVAVSLVALVVIGAMYRKLDRRQHALRWGLPLVFGGAIGNLVDRIRYGQVVDFIDVVYWKNKAGLERHWPTFNVADIAICIGVILMAYDFLFPVKQPTRKPRPAIAAAAGKPTSTSP